MSSHIKRISGMSAVCALIVWIGTSVANEETSVLVNRPAELVMEGPALPPPANPNQPDSTSADSNVEPSAPLQPQSMTRQPPSRGWEKQPFMRPAAPKQGAVNSAERPRGGYAQLTSAEEPLPAPPQPVGRTAQLDIRPTPPIEYDTDGDARDLYRESGEIELVMVTMNPADGCYYEIPLCIPGCCVDEPTVSGGRGIFGRGVVEYRWACGFKAEIKFRQILGDVKVEYEGD